MDHLISLTFNITPKDIIVRRLQFQPPHTKKKKNYIRLDPTDRFLLDLCMMLKFLHSKKTWFVWLFC